MADGRRNGAVGGRVYRAEALVLRRLSLGEMDRVVTLFTRERGKLNAVAKGARGPRSKLAGATEPFTWFSALLAQGQNLDVLTQAQVENAFPGIRKDLERIGYASYFLEVVDGGVEERQEMPILWDLVVAALLALEAAPSPDLLARAFEVQALALLGYEPRLHECVQDERPIDPAAAAFHPLRGGMLCPRCARAPGAVPLQSRSVAVLRALGQTPLVRVAHAELPADVRRDLARCLVPYLRHQLELPLRSLQFLDDVTGPGFEAAPPAA